MKKRSAIPDVDIKSAAGKRLALAVQAKLRDYLGKDYADESLAQYVVVMLAHKTEQQPVAANLEEFLGSDNAQELASWVFEELLPRFAAGEFEPAPATKAAAPAGAAPESKAAAKAAAGVQQAAGHSGAPGPRQANLPVAVAAQPKQAPVQAAGQQQQQQERRRSRSRSRGRSKRDKSYSGRSRSRSRGYSSRSYSRGSYSSYSGRSRSRSRSRRGHGRRHSRSRSRSRRRSVPPRPSRHSGRHGSSPHRVRRSPERGQRRREPSPRNGGLPFQRPYEGSSRRDYPHHPPPDFHRHRHDPRSQGMGSRRPSERLPSPRRPPLSPPRHRRRPGSPQRLEQPRAVRGRGRAGPEYEFAGREDDHWQAEEAARHQRQQQYQQQRGQHGGRRQQEEQVKPWERPSYMDLEAEGGALLKAPAIRSTVVNPQAQPPQHAPAAPEPAAGGAGGAAAMAPAHQEVPRRQPGTARGPQSTFARALQQATAPVRAAEGAGGSAAGLQRQVQGGGHRKAASLRITVTANGNEHDGLDGQQAQQQQQQAQQWQQQQAAGAQARGAAAAAPSVFARLSRTVPSGGADALNASGSAPSGGAAQGAWEAEEEWEGMEGPSPMEGGAGGGALLSDQEALKQRMRRMELELTRLRAEAGEVAGRGGMQPGAAAAAARASLALRSVCVTGVHTAATEAVLSAHFKLCGAISRVTLLKEPATGENSGAAWVQFATQEGAQAALQLSGSSLLQRKITVMPKESAAAKAATSRLLKRPQPAFPPVVPAPALVPVPVPLFPAGPPPFSGPPKRRRVGGRGKSLVYVRQPSS